ncbi:MAG: hypothetical protein FWF68_07250 [Spirochaetes bacterium]|nr:hypothetical protein [Spirochaetota bacterium]
MRLKFGVKKSNVGVDRLKRWTSKLKQWSYRIRNADTFDINRRSRG